MIIYKRDDIVKTNTHTQQTNIILDIVTIQITASYEFIVLMIITTSYE